MPDPDHRRCILIVEDQYLIADDLQHQLEHLGVVVIGPAPNVAAALRLVAATPILDGAILDIQLGNEKSYPVADALHERAIPFVFTTGYDRAMLPERFQDVRCFEKPVDMREVVRAILG